MIGQSLVAFQLLIDQEDSLPELVRVESSRDAPQSVGTGQRFAQPLFPEAGEGTWTKALRLGRRVQNRTRVALTTAGVERRGSNLRSPKGASSVAERQNIFSP